MVKTSLDSNERDAFTLHHIYSQKLNYVSVLCIPLISERFPLNLSDIYFKSLWTGSQIKSHCKKTDIFLKVGYLY